MIPPDAELTAAPRRDPGLGGHGRGAQAGAAPADGELRRLPGAHRPPRRPAVDALEELGAARRHADLLHHRRQRRLGRGHAAGHVQRADQPQRHGRAGDARVPHQPARQARRPGVRRRTTPSAGRTRCARRTSGPSRSPRTGAAPATARSCTGRTGIAAKGELRHQFSHVIDVAPTVLEAAGIAAADAGQRRHAAADAGRQHALQLRRRRRRRSATRPSTSRSSATAAIYHQRLVGGDQAPHAVADHRRRRHRVRRRRLGALRRLAATGRRPATCPRRTPTSCTSSSGCS